MDNMLKAMAPFSMYVLRIYTSVYKELESYCVGLDVLKETADELITECFIATACDYGLSLYEKLNGPERTDFTTEQRRNMLIQAVTVDCNDNTLNGIYQYLSSLGLECVITENPHICDLYILATGGEYTPIQKKYIREKAEDFLPCHLTFTIDFRSLDWEYLDSLGLVFHQIDLKDMTWSDFEDYEEE